MLNAWIGIKRRGDVLYISFISETTKSPGSKLTSANRWTKSDSFLRMARIETPVASARSRFAVTYPQLDFYYQQSIFQLSTKVLHELPVEEGLNNIHGRSAWFLLSLIDFTNNQVSWNL